MIYLYTNVEFSNILNQFVFQHFRAKVKVTVGVVRGMLSGPLIFRLILIKLLLVKLCS